MEPPRHHSGHRNKATQRISDREERIRDVELPLRCDLADSGKRSAANKRSSDDDPAHIEPDDQPGREQSEQSADDEEDRDRKRDRAERPILFLADCIGYTESP